MISSSRSRVDVVFHRFAVRDGGTKINQRLVLELEVALEHFLDVLANQQLVEFLKIGQAFEKQDSLDQPVGMLHLG